MTQEEKEPIDNVLYAAACGIKNTKIITEEDYINFEIAELLREKGFNEENSASIKVFGGHTYIINKERISPKKDTIIPTIQTTMKWLREIHHITIGISFNYNKISYEIQKDNEFIVKVYTPLSHKKACEDAIKFCLKLI